MGRFLLLTLSVLASGWLVPVTLVGATYGGVAGLCAMQKCVRDMSKGDTPHPIFHVLVRDTVAPNVITAVLLKDLPDYLASNPKASLRLPAAHGLTNDGNWEYSIESNSATEQIVTASFHDDASISEKYRVLGGSVQPLVSEVRNSGYLFTSVLFGLLVSWGIRKVAVRLKWD